MRCPLLCQMVVLLLISTTATKADELNGKYSITFPNEKTKLWSPNGLYAVECISENGDPQNHLYFMTRKPSLRRPLRLIVTKANGFNHRVDVLWSPASTQFIINDWSAGPGSYVDSYLYKVSDIAHPVDIGNRFGKSIPEPNAVLEELTTEAWQNIHSVRIHVSMMQSIKDRSSSELTYVWDIVTNKFECLKKD